MLKHAKNVKTCEKCYHFLVTLIGKVYIYFFVLIKGTGKPPPKTSPVFWAQIAELGLNLQGSEVSRNNI